MKSIGYAAQTASGALSPFSFERRDLRDNDVAMDILYCGVCHSDLHYVKNDWGKTVYPFVPGHEIVGRVTDTGTAVTKYKKGDIVAVGCMVDSCQDCDQCHDHQEQYCREGWTGTYNAPDRQTGDINYGGYSDNIVVREEFVLSVPKGLDIAKAAPLLCAGITSYSPLREWNIGPGSRVGVVGMGGLGHMAIKLAHAMGAIVTVVSRSPDKKNDAVELGADHFLVSEDADQMQQFADAFDLIIDTVPVKHDINPYLPLLDIDGTLCLVGQIGPLTELTTPYMIRGRRRVAGSIIGGIRETQECLDFCARFGINPEVEMIRMDEINEAYERMERSDVHYRFVIDMQSLKG